jgi:hypothetical protein
LVQEQADLSFGKLPGVHFAALEKLEKVLQEKQQFEERIALEQVTPSNDESEEELEELCRVVSDVPNLWHHEAVTHQERKEILRCVVDSIVVVPSREKLDATICWKSGANTSLSVWRPRSRHHLIRELHAQQLTASEIKERLAAGRTSTGQTIKISVAGIQVSLQKMGLRAAKHSAEYLSTRQKAVELDREGQSVESIAQNFNEQGFATPSGKPWTHFMVEHLLRANGQNQEPLEKIHRKAIAEARARGLNHQQIADEFNEKQIRRRGGLGWTAKSVATRWSDLKRIEHDREETELKRSA